MTMCERSRKKRPSPRRLVFLLLSVIWVNHALGCGEQEKVNCDEWAGKNAFVAKYDPQGEHLWNIKLTDADSTLLVDSSANAILFGAFTGTQDFGFGEERSPDEPSCFIAKYGPDRTPKWIDIWPESSFSAECPRIGSVVSDGGIVVARGEHEVWGSYMRKYDPDGHHLWTTDFSGLPFVVEGVVADSSENILVTAQRESSIEYCGEQLAGCEYCNFVAKLDSSGGCLWLVDAAQNVAVAVDSEDNVFVLSDSILTKYDPLGSEVWLQDIGLVEAGIGLYETGSLSVFTDHTPVVLRLEQSGNEVWRAVLDAGCLEDGCAYTLDGSQQSYVLGSLDGEMAFSNGQLSGADSAFVLKIDNNGEYAAGRVMERSSGRFGHLVVDFSENLIMARGDEIAKFDTALNVKWAFVYERNSAGCITRGDIAIDHHNNLLVAGDFNGNLDLAPAVKSAAD